MSRRYETRLSEREIRALLALCPKCRDCGMRAELVLNGAPRCVPGAGKIPKGTAETPAWSNAADALECALSPFGPQRREPPLEEGVPS